MIIKIDNFLSNIAIRFPTKKKDKNQRYKLSPVEIFPESDRDIIWNFINRYLAKNTQRRQWLESCGIQLMGSGVSRTMLVSSTVNICLDTFPKGNAELSQIWDNESGSKKRKQCSSLLTPEPCAQKKSRYKNGMCSVKPFIEQHSKSQTRIVSKLSKIAQQGIRAELGDKSTENVQAVTLAVSVNISKVLSEYCINEGILDNARRMLQRIYGDEAVTGDIDMYMRGLKKMEKRIAKRGTVHSKFRVGNFKRSLQATEASLQCHQIVIEHLTKAVCQDNIIQLIVDKSYDTNKLTKMQREKLRLQALCTMAVSRDLYSKYTIKREKIQLLIANIQNIRESKHTESDKESIIHLEMEKHDKYMMSWRVEKSLPIIVGNITALQCDNKCSARRNRKRFYQRSNVDNQYMS
jgi:hypothetical protein